MKAKREKLLNKLEELDAKAQEIREELENPETGWSPKGGRFKICGDGGVHFHSVSEDEYITHVVGHENRENAEKHAKAQRLWNWLYQLALELNKGWTIDDWDGEQCIFVVMFDESNNKFWIEFWNRSVPYGVPFYKSEELAEKAIEIIKTWELDKWEKALTK